MLLKYEGLRLSLGSGFFLMALIFMCIALRTTGTPIPVETPSILLLASLFLLVPSQSTSPMATLQKITTLFLTSVLLDEVRIGLFSLPLGPHRLQISYSVVVLLLCAIGFFLYRVRPSHRQDASLYQAWLWVGAIVIAHMVFLYGLLKTAYGYGYERDIHVLGSIGLYLLQFYLLWPQLERPAFRQLSGLVFAGTVLFCM